MMINILHLQNIMQLHEHQLIDDLDYEAWLTAITAQFMTPGGRVWWQKQKNTLTPPIVAVLDRKIADNPCAPNMRDLWSDMFEVES